MPILFINEKDKGGPIVERLDITDDGIYQEAGKAYSPVVAQFNKGTKTVTQNGTYKASDDNLAGFSEVNVNLPLATKSITANGNYKASDDNLEGFSEVDVNVPLPSNAYLKKSVSGLPQPIASFSDGADEVLNNLVVDITPTQSGSGDPSPSNIRPISGWTGAKVNVSGVNLFNTKILTDAGATVNDGVYSGTLSVFSSTDFGYLKFKNNTQYTMSLKGQISQGYLQITLRYTDGTSTNTTIIFVEEPNVKKSVTSAENKTLASIAFRGYASVSNASITMTEIQLEEGGTATTYTPYNGHTCSIPFTDGQGQSVTTYYGEYSAIDGVLSDNSNDTYMTFDGSSDEAWTANAYNYFKIKVGEYGDVETGKILCDKLPTKRINSSDLSAPAIYLSNSQGNNYAMISVRPTTYDIQLTLNEFKQWLSENPITVVFKKSTAVTIQLAPTAVRSLLGSNNIFADSGDVESCGYWSKTE